MDLLDLKHQWLWSSNQLPRGKPFTMFKTFFCCVCISNWCYIVCPCILKMSQQSTLFPVLMSNHITSAVAFLGSVCQTVKCASSVVLRLLFLTPNSHKPSQPYWDVNLYCKGKACAIIWRKWVNWTWERLSLHLHFIHRQWRYNYCHSSTENNELPAAWSTPQL